MLKTNSPLRFVSFTIGRSSVDSKVWQNSSAVPSADAPRIEPIGCGFPTAIASSRLLDASNVIRELLKPPIASPTGGLAGGSFPFRCDRQNIYVDKPILATDAHMKGVLESLTHSVLHLLSALRLG